MQLLCRGHAPQPSLFQVPSSSGTRQRALQSLENAAPSMAFRGPQKAFHGKHSTPRVHGSTHADGQIVVEESYLTHRRMRRVFAKMVSRL